LTAFLNNVAGRIISAAGDYCLLPGDGFCVTVLLGMFIGFAYDVLRVYANCFASFATRLFFWDLFFWLAITLTVVYGTFSQQLG
jgi:hypothetical protein